MMTETSFLGQLSILYSTINLQPKSLWKIYVDFTHDLNAGLTLHFYNL